MKRLMITVTALAAALLLAFAWLGYLGGNPFTIWRPTGYQARPHAPVAIVLSGDMGLRFGMGTQVTRHLVHDGIPVVGINSLTYFRTTRTAADATALVEDGIRRARSINPNARIMLVGQSYGADMLHVGLAGLPVRARRQIALVALVVPGATVEYRASPGELTTFAMAESDALPTAKMLTWVPVTCIYGVAEAASLCPLLHQPNVRAVPLPGGHPLHRDVNAVYGAIRGAMIPLGLTERH
ncbi:MAG: type IV secretion system protein VirJ [bacterium]|nr:type IV secretion system protein VirJ [bacterium]